ncbi:MAG: hypothetical protein AB1758_13970 [Candidatus Eremiobacterota bacterium]
MRLLGWLTCVLIVAVFYPLVWKDKLAACEAADQELAYARERLARGNEALNQDLPRLLQDAQAVQDRLRQRYRERGLPLSLIDPEWDEPLHQTEPQKDLPDSLKTELGPLAKRAGVRLEGLALDAPALVGHVGHGHPKLYDPQKTLFREPELAVVRFKLRGKLADQVAFLSAALGAPRPMILVSLDLAEKQSTVRIATRLVPIP